jgi:dTDP-4-amino-4,6-dideoxygalactose transaminase
MLAPEAPLSRDALLDGLTARKIGTGVHYRGVHLHPYFRDTYGLKPENFPVATAISERSLSLPLSPKVPDSDQDDVITATEHLLET